MRNGHKHIIQDHSVLARRCRSMVNAIIRRSAMEKMTDEQKAAKERLEEQAIEHERKAIIRNSFILIL
jgi:hypothetical protein